jgi:hypothetical protein
VWKSHLGHLLYKAWAYLLSELSSSTLAVAVFSVAVPIITFSAVFIYQFCLARRERSDIKAMLRKTFVPTLIAAGIIVAAWLCLFGWSVAATIYKDHQFLVSTIGEKDEAIAKLKAQLDAKPAGPVGHWTSNDITARPLRESGTDEFVAVIQSKVMIQPVRLKLSFNAPVEDLVSGLYMKVGDEQGWQFASHPEWHFVDHNAAIEVSFDTPLNEVTQLKVFLHFKKRLNTDLELLRVQRWSQK